MYHSSMEASVICDTVQPDDGASQSERIALLAHRLDQQVRAHLDCQLAEFDLTGPQAMLLRHLDTPLAMQEVAAKLHCDPSNVTGIVDRLEHRGLLERRVLPSDRRVKELVLTADGRRIRECLLALLETIPGIASLSDADQQRLHDLLAHAVAAGEAQPAGR
jgi:DNA-binding MarR family transcriptional regulator